MNRGTLAGLIGVAGILAAGSFLLLGGPEVSELDTVTGYRLALVAGECPADECQWSQIEGGYCACLTGKTQVAGEVTQDDLADADRHKMLVCNPDDLEAAGGRRWEVRYVTHATVVSDKDRCIEVAQDMPPMRMQLANVDDPVTARLAAACTPCPIRPGSWGPCPYCLHPGWGERCAEACSDK